MVLSVVTYIHSFGNLGVPYLSKSLLPNVKDGEIKATKMENCRFYDVTL